MTDDQFMASFENATLSSASFHHADHVKMAFLYLSRYQAIEALQQFSAGLMKFAAANNKPALYNETVTWAFVLLIRERMARAGDNLTWAQFAAHNPDLVSSKDILKKYYRDETLSSDLAKSTFLLPDKFVARF